MGEFGILLTFTGGLTVALILGFVAVRLKLSPIVDYLLAGIVVGPFTPGFIADHTVAKQFSEIGVILLLFGIGLRFHLIELVAVWRVAIPGALVQSVVSTLVLALILRLVGWSWTSGIILGMAVSVASTVVMALVLAERHDLHSPIGHIAFGWTVVEDILTVIMMLMLPILFSPGGDIGKHPLHVLGLTAVKITGLLAAVVLLGKWAIPWALEKIEKTRSHELFTLAVLALAMGIAVGSSKIFGVSMALGAFLAGLAVGRSDFGARAAADAVPMRDAFAVLFFVSVGMLFNPASLVKAPMLICIVTVVVIVIKPLAALLTVRLLGKPFTTAIPVGAAFSQIGEFSFILGTAARHLNLIDDISWNAIVAASIISITLNPSIYLLARSISSSACRKTPNLPVSHQAIDRHRCIIIGYGPVGRIVHRLLSERGVDITVVDLNLDTVRSLRTDGKKAVYGDVVRPGTLEDAGVVTTGSLILTADVEDASEVIRQAKIINPQLQVLVRCTNLRDAPALRRAGADMVAAGEAEVGVAFAESILSMDTLDCDAFSRQRETIRNRLYGVE